MPTVFHVFLHLGSCAMLIAISVVWCNPYYTRRINLYRHALNLYDHAFHSMLWVSLFTTFTVYMFAVAATTIVGQEKSGYLLPSTTSSPSALSACGTLSRTTLLRDWPYGERSTTQSSSPSLLC